MRFKKTKNRTTNNLLKELDSYGTYYNAATTYEYTAFEIHGNNKDFHKLFNILIDMYFKFQLRKRPASPGGGGIYCASLLHVVYVTHDKKSCRFLTISSIRD